MREDDGAIGFDDGNAMMMGTTMLMGMMILMKTIPNTNSVSFSSSFIFALFSFSSSFWNRREGNEVNGKKKKKMMMRKMRENGISPNQCVSSCKGRKEGMNQGIKLIEIIWNGCWIFEQ